MADKIKVLIADDIAATKENVRKLLAFHAEVAVVGEAGTAQQAISKAKNLKPDIILMDINMPGMDGIAATEILAEEVPTASIVIMSVQGEQEYLRRAMIAGAKNYLVKPFTGDELIQAIKQVYQNDQRRKQALGQEQQASVPGKIITVFSTKGGIGKTTIATNLAVALADAAGGKVAVVDADLQFGDVALFLNIVPQATVADMVRDVEHMDENLLDSYMIPYSDNLKVLAAPLRPEQAETVTASHLTAILKTMRSVFDYIIVDTAPSFNEAMLSVLDAADQIVVVAAMDLPTIKNVKLCLEIMESLGYGHDKIKMVLNRANSDSGMDISEVEESLQRVFAAAIPSDGKLVVSSVNRGVPFVVSHPAAAVSQGVYQLAALFSGGCSAPEIKPQGVVSKLKRLFR